MRPTHNDTSAETMVPLAESELARAHGGTDPGKKVSVLNAELNAPFALRHYNGAYNLLRSCSDEGKCEAPNRMQAGAMLGAAGLPVDEVVNKIKLPFPLCVGHK